MNKLISFLGVLIVIHSFLSACTSDAWRASAKESAKQECLNAPIGEQQRCLDRLTESQR